MEVTRGNFREVLAELESVIAAAQFLAIDGEFTGLHSGQDVNAFDTPAQYYSKLRSSWMDFLLVQFGLCAFNYDKENDKYTHRAYNFYIFPRPQGRASPDPRFLCQSSSIEFLASQGFDFNILFKEGIPYLTQPDEQKLRERILEKQKTRDSLNNSSPSNGENSAVIPIPEEYVSTIENVCSQIETFLTDTEHQELELNRHNAFVRKLIFQTVSQRFDNNVVRLESRQTEDRNRVLIVTRAGSEEERKRKEQEKKEKEMQELEDAIGFSSVVQLISQSGKLIIGHNMLLDICHVIHQCYFPLPDSYCEFKEMVSCTFPKLLDTKYMSFLPPFKDKISSSILGHLYKTLSEEPFKMSIVQPEEDGHGYTSLDEKYHEAAYDAYVTGLCFIAMCNYLGSSQKPKVDAILPSSPLLNPYLNKLFLVRLQDCPYMNLQGEDPVSPRDHVFFVSFPEEWKLSDLIQLFSPFGSVFVAWLSNTSAYVSLNHRQQAALVQKTLTQSDTYTVMTYAAHQQLLKCRSEIKDKPLCSSCTSAKSSVKQIVPSSPTASLRKRRSLEALQDDTEVQATAPKRKRSRSFGDKTTFSKRIIDPIPEEQEVDDVRHTEERSEKQDTQVNSKRKSSGAGKPCDSSKNNSPSPTDKMEKKKSRKQFKEIDTWD